MWLQLCDLCSQHPEKVKKLRVERIIRGGLRRFTDEVCWLVCLLLCLHFTHFKCHDLILFSTKHFES